MAVTRLERYIAVSWGLRLLGVSTADALRCARMLVDCEYLT